jgi:hypothetical protein
MHPGFAGQAHAVLGFLPQTVCHTQCRMVFKGMWSSMVEQVALPATLICWYALVSVFQHD